MTGGVYILAGGRTRPSIAQNDSVSDLASRGGIHDFLQAGGALIFLGIGMVSLGQRKEPRPNAKALLPATDG